MEGRFVEDLKSLEDLLELMDIDLKIDRLLDQRSSLPALAEYKESHGEVERLTAASAQAHTAMKDADKGVSKTSGELEIMAEKAASEQNRLYAGGISARDADYLRREVEMLYGKVSKMEDEVLEYLEAKELAETEFAGLGDELAGVTWRLIDKELAVKENRKKGTIELVDEYLLDIYEDLRRSEKGRVVGRLNGDTCGACHLKLSAAEVVRVQKQDPPRCIHCRAILVG